MSTFTKQIGKPRAQHGDTFNEVAWQHGAWITLRFIQRMMVMAGLASTGRMAVHSCDHELRVVDHDRRDSEGHDRFEAVVYLPESGRVEFHERMQSGDVQKTLLVGDVAEWSVDMSMLGRRGVVRLVSKAGNVATKRINW